MEELYWYFYLFCLGLFLVLVHLTPDQVTLLQSNAYTTLLQWNYGKDSLELQSICVIVYHQSLLGRLTHLTLITDNIAWIILSCSNFYLFIAITLLPLFQAVTLSKDKSYIFSLNLSWILLCIGGFLSHYFVDTEFLTWTCRIVVLAGAIIRTIGHVFEKVPPLIGGIDHRQFGPEIGTSFYFSLVWNFRAEILFLPFLGVLSEAAAGFPTRLWPSIVYLSYCYFKNPSELTKLREASEKISDNGWTSHPITQKLFGWSSKKD